jgi:hypothetical protein
MKIALRDVPSVIVSCFVEFIAFVVVLQRALEALFLVVDSFFFVGKLNRSSWDETADAKNHFCLLVMVSDLTLCIQLHFVV